MSAIINNRQIDGQTWVTFQTPYNYDFVQALKSKIHYADRKWNQDSKLWMVTEGEADTAIAVAAKYFDVRDQREMSIDDAEEDMLQAEIEKIKADQAYIIQQSEHINDAIKELGIAIGRYSHMSKSSVKDRMCRDRALLQHSLDNAQKPIEQLVEMEIRGMSAAVRLINENSIAKLTSR
jgi:hypothetical protein